MWRLDAMDDKDTLAELDETDDEAEEDVDVDWNDKMGVFMSIEFLFGFLEYLLIDIWT